MRAEALDERLVRRTYLNDAGVLAYRHYELVTDAPPDFRIALAPRASIDNGTLIIRKALRGRPRSASTSTAAAATTTSSDHVLAQAGGAFVLAASWSTRLTRQLRPGARDRDRACPARCRSDG